MSLEIKISSTGKYLNVNSLGKNTNRQMIPKNLPETNRKVQNVLVRMKKDLAEMIKADIENNIKRGVFNNGNKKRFFTIYFFGCVHEALERQIAPNGYV